MKRTYRSFLLTPFDTYFQYTFTTFNTILYEHHMLHEAHQGGTSLYIPDIQYATK